MNIKYIKKYLMSKIGCQIAIICFGSRNRKERYQGYLLKTYPNVFTIQLVSGEIKSFNYIDILTKNIQIYV